MEHLTWNDIETTLHNLVRADGGFSTAHRGVVPLADGTRVFVKIGVDDNTRMWAKKEIVVYRFLERQNYPYIPRLLAVSPDETGFALGVLDTADGWDWSESWTKERLDKALEAMDTLAAIIPNGEDKVFFSHSAIDQSDNGWRPLADSEEKQKILLAKLRDAGYGAVADSLDFAVMTDRSERYIFEDNHLVHNDVRADNAAWNKNTKEVKLVDWNWTQLGDRRIDLAATLTHVQKSGFDVLPNYASRLDADALHWMAGFWFQSAIKSIWPGGPAHLRDHQLKAGVTALELLRQVGLSLMIEKARPADAPAIFDVQRQTWLATYPNEEAGITYEDIRKRLEGENGELIPQKVGRWKRGIETAGDTRQIFVARDDGEVIGFVAPGIMNGQRRIGAIYVLPGAQGKGIGSKLLQKALEWHGDDEDIFLHVAAYNQKAIDFYKKHGFGQTATTIVDETALQNGNTPIPEIEMVRRARKVV